MEPINDTDVPPVPADLVEPPAAVEPPPPEPVEPPPPPEPVVREAQPVVVVPTVPHPAGDRKYPSLYDTTGTTIVAILLGMVIVGGIQWFVQRIYLNARSEYEVLTRFVVTIVSLVIGAYITDLLIAGPDTSLLSDDEHTIILGFIKDICLMVFAYYFGTKSGGSQPARDPA